MLGVPSRLVLGEGKSPNDVENDVDTVDAIERRLNRIFKGMRDYEKVAAERAGLPPRNRLFFAGRWIDKKPGGQ